MDKSGQVQTVLGLLSPGVLGVTMAHEHLLIDGACLYAEPTTARDKARARQPISLEILYWVRYHPNSHLDNLLQGDEDTSISEAMLYKRAGGQTIVDCTSIGLGRDPLALARVSRATGLNVIAATGYYVAHSHPADMAQRSEEELEEQMVRDITDGIDDTGVKAGIIGELGCSWPLHPNERKVLRAAAKAQRRTGAPISIHPGRDDAAPMEILGILKEAGADISHTIMGHIERTAMKRSTLKRIAETGCFVEYDLFGQDLSYYAPAPHIANPTDAQRMDQIEWLIAEGHTRQVLLSQDAGTKVRLVRYGGHGFAHILETVLPWMRRRGFRDEHVQAMLVDNPSRALTFG